MEWRGAAWPKCSLPDLSATVALLAIRCGATPVSSTNEPQFHGSQGAEDAAGLFGFSLHRPGGKQSPNFALKRSAFSCDQPG